jgi:hypothetical protein
VLWVSDFTYVATWQGEPVILAGASADSAVVPVVWTGSGKNKLRPVAG